MRTIGTIIIPLLAAIVVLLFWDDSSLREKDRIAYVPTTKKRVASITHVPADVQKVFRASLFDPRIKDREEAWSGGCMAGPHFLEAGETSSGWWIFYEQGGIGDSSSYLSIIERRAGVLSVITRHSIAR